MNNNNEASFISSTELAKLLGVSRVTIFNRIKKGIIKAKKIGRNFVIDTRDISELHDEKLREDDKQQIQKAVKKTVAEYGETLRLLGKE